MLLTIFPGLIIKFYVILQLGPVCWAVSAIYSQQDYSLTCSPFDVLHKNEKWDFKLRV